jgi:VCBS repeat-containing protein
VTNAGTHVLTFGTLAINFDGTYTYTLDNLNPAVNALNTGQTITDAFEYVASDGVDGSDTASLTITTSGVTDPVT